MLRRRQKGQSVLEYTVLLVIVMGALIAMTQYIKRAVQGRWKTVVDDMGDQYDPRLTEIRINHTVVVNQDSTIRAVKLGGQEVGYWTSRVDQSNVLDQKVGHMFTDVEPDD